MEGAAPADQLVEDRSEREHIGPRIHMGGVEGLFGGHVAGRPDADARAGFVQRVVIPEHLDQAEVGDLGDQFAGIVCQQDVRGLEIPMHHTLAVGEGNRREDALGDGLHFIEGQAAVGQVKLQRRARDVLHDEAGSPRDVEDVRDRQDVGMAQAGLNTPLLDKPPLDGLGHQVQNLEGIGRVQLVVADPVDGRHAAFPHHLFNGVPADDAAWVEPHSET